MVTTAVILGVMVTLALFAKTYSWRVKGVIAITLVAMIIVLMR